MKKYLTYLIASLGGFQFGFNSAIMAGAILFITPDLDLTPLQESYLMTIFMLGYLLGSSTIGSLANSLGRKKAQICLALLFVLGSGALLVASSLSLLLGGRLIQGFASGAATVLAPLYLAEIAPPEKRGVVVGINQFALTVGGLLAYGMSYLFASTQSWHLMLGLSMIPALLYFVGLFQVPESRSVKTESTPWRTIFKPEYRSTLSLIVLLNVVQQVTGINAICAYAPTIFYFAGLSDVSLALFFTIFVGLINVVATWIAMALIDRIGRRPLLLSSLFGMIVSLLTTSLAFMSDSPDKSWIVVMGVILFTISFGIGLAITPGLIATEMFPNAIRGPATSFAALCNSICSLVVLFTFPLLAKTVGYQGIFAIYTIFALLGFLFAWRKIPETMGKVLE